MGSCLESLRISRFNAVGTISQTHIIHMLSEEPPEPLEYLFGKEPWRRAEPAVSVASAQALEIYSGLVPEIVFPLETKSPAPLIN